MRQKLSGHPLWVELPMASALGVWNNLEQEEKMPTYPTCTHTPLTHTHTDRLTHTHTRHTLTHRHHRQTHAPTHTHNLPTQKMLACNPQQFRTFSEQVRCTCPHPHTHTNLKHTYTHTQTWHHTHTQSAIRRCLPVILSGLEYSPNKSGALSERILATVNVLAFTLLLDTIASLFRTTLHRMIASSHQLHSQKPDCSQG